MIQPFQKYKYSDAMVKKLTSPGLENFHAHKYRDGGGLWTIGYGERCGEHDYPNGITEAEAAVFLKGRLGQICFQLSTIFDHLQQHQVDALCMFIYNIGWDAFKTSHTCRLLLAHDYGAFDSWGQWIHDDKKQVEEGLVTRRAYEIALFVFGVY